MKIFDKIKDLFTDEIIEEKEEVIEIKEEKKDNNELKLPKVMREEKEIESSINDIDFINDFQNVELNNQPSNNGNFRFPISFEENDLLDEKILSNQNIMYREKKEEKISKPESELYSKKNLKEEKVTFFKVSPVISPVYGILDKNYKTEEVQSKSKSKNEIVRNNKKVDFETVRKKAYGSLIDDIKDNLSDIKTENKKEEIIDENIFKLNENIEEITFGDMEENFHEFGLTFDDYKKNDKEKEGKKEDIKIVTMEDNDTKIEKIDINEGIINKKKQENDFELENKNDDIFNLIDNMYQEKEEANND